jgi:hypothetical protein
VGGEVAQMAQLFWEAHLEGKDIVQSCAEVVACGQATLPGGCFEPVLAFFNNNYGYANPWWEPEDLCPIAEQR